MLQPLSTSNRSVMSPLQGINSAKLGKTQNNEGRNEGRDDTNLLRFYYYLSLAITCKTF